MIRRSLVILLVASTMGCRERFYQSFGSGEAAHQSELAKQGWVPQWLPSEAVAVQVEHDIDTNERWLRFRLPNTSAAALKQNLEKLSDTEVINLRIRSPKKTRWFESLIQQAPETDGSLNAAIFRGNGKTVENSAILLFERTSEDVYAYLPTAQ